MSFIERLRRIPTTWWVAIFAVVLVLPRIWSYGFWEPWELKIGEHARDMADGALADVTVNKRYPAEPPLNLLVSALGMKIFGVGEFGGRIGNGLFAIVAIFAVYWAGLGLLRRRAALLSALALGAMPLFVLQSRQIVSDMPLVASLALTLGGLGRYAWPPDGLRRLRDAVVAGVGLLLGLFSGGALLGVALPCLALTGSLLVAFGLQARGGEASSPADAAADLCAPGVGRDVPAGMSFGRGLFLRSSRGRLVLATAALLGIAVFVFTLTTANVANKYSLLLGGVPKAGTPTTTFDYLVKQLGFGLFPWSAFAVFALGRPLIRLGGGSEPDGDRIAFSQLYLLVFAAFGFALSSYFVVMTGQARFVALAPIALAVGALLDEALEGRRAEPVLGLLVATGTIVVARDLVLEPEELVSVHTLAKVKWPEKVKMGWMFMAAGVLFAGGIYTGLATRGRALGRVALRELGTAGKWRRRIEKGVVEAGRYGIQVAVTSAVVFGLAVGHVVVPVLSKHLSFKPLLESYAKFARHGEKIGRYKVEAQGAGFYSRREMTDLPTPERVASFLRSGERVFALVSAAHLAVLDATLKSAKVDYFVVDGRSSRFLLLSNRLLAGEKDENPLKKDVWMAPQLPRLVAGPPGPNGETTQKSEWPDQPVPWKWRVPARTMFEDAIELVGADFPPSIRRPGTIPLTLYFRVHKKPRPGFRVFVHFDAPGEPRLLGDHALLNGTFPTDYWLPGEYIRDSYDVEVPLMTTPAGRYTLLIGFWPGGEGKRLRITAGHNDGGDRTQVGFIEIK
ncbi:MAG: glycosyltransferase family 39 protein [Deltaproteobacteria bacterium]|nr:glycosyltransferase family 39 protein [Deltaproteobacteria bacterium]